MTRKSQSQLGAEASVEGFREDLGPFVVAAETTRMPMIFTNALAPGDPIIFANEAFLSLTGFSRDQLLESNLNALLADDAGSDAAARIANAFSGEPGTPDLHFSRQDGSEFWATLFVSPVRNEAREVVQHFASLIDGTRHMEQQSRCMMLIDELNHRVKNTLSTVQSIVSQALRNQSDPSTIRESIESRIFALSRSHNLLTRVNWGGSELRDLVSVALEPFIATETSERFVIDGKTVLLLPKTALALAIAFHELATNAIKFGALSDGRGWIGIAWKTERRSDGERLSINWQERGGPPVTVPTRKGFGSQVIERGLAHELSGAVELSFLPSGVLCQIDIPLTAVGAE